MSGKIFLLDDDDDVRAVIEEREFKDEDRLQREIERTPDLIPGDQIEPDSPRRWLFVEREAGIPGERGAGNRWSLDHLLLDQDGISTFVECKLSGNPELRRQVVAQMLEYAANALAHWPPGRVREAAEGTAMAAGKSIEAATLDLLESDDLARVDPFWSQVDENLADGRLRLVFAAPTIPGDLQTIVDFLNGQMAKTDVVAVEVKLFEGDAIRALVPRVTGRSPYGRAASRSSTRARLSIERLIADVSDPKFRSQLNAVADKLADVGARPEPGDLGVSWRLRLSRLVSIGWFFPEGRAGWMGMRNLTIGIALDQADGLEANEREAVESFVRRIEQCAGGAFDRDWFRGKTFDAGNLGAAIPEITAALDELARDLRPA